MSAYQVVGAIAGVIVGVVTENPQAGFATFSAISALGAYMEQPDRIGPRLDDLRTQMSVYGNPIPFEYGCNRHAGTVIWPRILEAVEHEHSESAKGGPEQKTYTYTMTLGVLVCEGPIAGIRRIWANKKLVYDASSSNTGATRDPAIGALRIYLGTETQEVDPLIEATDGPSPAYLGYAYVVLEDYDVTEMNGRPPQFEFEVVSVGTPVDPNATSIGASGNEADYDPNSFYVWSVEGTPNTKITVYINDLVTNTVVDQFDYVPTATAATMGSDICYVPQTNEFWVVNTNGTNIVAIKADTQVIREIDFGRSWTGLIHYCPTNGNVVMGTTNIAPLLYVIDVASETIVQTINTTGVFGGMNQIITLENGKEATLSDNKLTICTINGSSSSIDATYTSSDIGSSSFMFADPSRDRIVIVNDTSSTLVVLDTVTGLFSTHALDFPIDMPPTASTSLKRGLFHVQNDEYYLTAHQAGLGWTLHTVDPDEFQVMSSRVYAGPTSVGTMIEIPGQTSYFVYTDSGTDQAWKIPVQGTVDPSQVTLASIVTNICERAGLDAGDIDVTELTDLVDGYIVPRQMIARAALEPLQKAYYFDAVESDDKIKFVKRGSMVTTLIPMDDRAAHVAGQEMPANLEIRRAFETELPIQMDVEYVDVNADHQIGNQYDRRITKDTRNKANIQLAIVMPATKAKEVARVNLYDAWQTGTFRWCTTRKYAYLEPTDLVELPTESATYRARITNRRDQPNGLIEWEGREDAVEVYTQSGADAITPGYSPQTIFQPSTTVLELLDIPLVRDQDKDLGFYIAMCGTTASWPGAEVFRSADAGSTYNSILVHSIKTAIGTATTALGNFTGGDVIDSGNTVTVELTGGATLASYTEAQVLDGYGLFALGVEGRWEILHYTTATLVGANTYELSGLMRGRRGTEWAIGTHQVGDTFVLGSETGWRLYNAPGSDLNVERLYKAPAFRTTLASAAAKSLTDKAVRRRPYSVAHLKAEPLNDGGFTISWMHRSLVGSSWSSGLVVPLDATFTGFSVTISSIDGTVMRQFSTTSEAFPYSAAEIEADFGGTPPVILARVAQRNSDYGDGVGATMRTDTGEVAYDFDDPFADPYIPPDVTAPPESPSIGDPIPPENQYFGPDYWAPALWDGTRFIASNAYQKAIPGNGRLWTSTDGLNFTQLSASNMTIPLSITAHHSGVYVNQWESSNPWHSTDLQVWTEGSFNAYASGYPFDSRSPFSKIVHDGTRFVAVRRNGEIVSSASGSTWDHKCNVTTPTDTSGYFAGNGLEAWGLAYGAGIYVAVGLEPSGHASLSDRIWTSSTYDGPYTARDGAPVVSFGGSPVDKAYLYSVTFNSADGYFYACGAKRYYFEPSGYYISTGVIIRSSDGITWVDVTPAPVVAPTYTSCVAYSFHVTSGGYVVTGSNAYWTSADGVTWAEHGLAPYNENQLLSLNFGASNGTILATQERQWLFRNVTHLGYAFTFIDQYRKPITFDGSDFNPTLDSPYP